jgi:hypothetical protein
LRRECIKPAGDSSTKRSLATDVRRESRARAQASLGARAAWATLDASATVDSDGDSEDRERHQQGNETRPAGQREGSAGQEAAHHLRQTPAQRKPAEHDRREPRDGRNPRGRTSQRARERARQQPCSEKHASLAQTHAPTDAQHFAPIRLAQRMMGEAMKRVRSASETIDPPRERQRKAGNLHDDFGASLTAVP